MNFHRFSNDFRYLNSYFDSTIYRLTLMSNEIGNLEIKTLILQYILIHNIIISV